MAPQVSSQLHVLRDEVLRVHQTPSPHRFLAGSRRAQSPTKETRPPSALRKQVTQAVNDHDSSTQQNPGPSQFAATPRFSIGKSKASTPTQRQSSPPRPALVKALRASGRPIEDVEEAPGGEDEMLLDEETSAIPTTEQDGTQWESNAQWANDLAFSPKRRRLDDSETLRSPTRTTFKQPQLPASHERKALPNFTHSTPRSESVEPTATQRPAFIRPSAVPQEPSEPLPDAFSPHRRGQKFVPGGLAATAQQWVLEAGQAAVQSRKGQGYLKGEDYIVRVRVDAIIGDGPFTARGRLPNGDEVNLLLAGGGNVSRPSESAVVGIRAPAWDIELDGRNWTVGVDWKVL